MLATLVIGLREGLEAVLIVTIIAAFLKRNGHSRRPMWIGVGVAVALSVAVAVALQLVERALPQAQQEGLESVIGLVAVLFVTTMIIWMGKHARGLKAGIEESATAALSSGTSTALAVMAALAVLKEGFESAVFLLATFQASSSTWAAATGAVIGIVTACVAGYFLYSGSIKLNIGRFFRISSVFLVFVAAGLLLTAARTAHEAGWIAFGQQRTLDLSWLAPIGSIRSALVTGVLGIPADPRMLEVLLWIGYLVPMLLLVLWPRKWAMAAPTVRRLKWSLAAVAAVAGIVMAIVIPASKPSVPTTVALVSGDGAAGVDQPSVGEASVSLAAGRLALHVDTAGGAEDLAFDDAEPVATVHAGVSAEQWVTRSPATAADQPTELTAEQLTTMLGRIPIGISLTQNPGPFQAAWSTSAVTTVWTVDGGVLDANQTSHSVLTLSGGGLATPRTVTVDGDGWAVPSATVQATSAAVTAGRSQALDRVLWRRWVPGALVVAALALTLAAAQSLRGARASAPAT